ncbi:ABC transporter ATP-binding protein [Solibacillus sp. MA9]|uniref:ABC transporter ATP-binding protein n=1 Tax=Solibacillus palustris TaxID=2908203 RepID=A0ABS9U8U9_9BACL|nr:ABC transporter ATP-binding protein [Solibacillus sp. MA9]MCH7320766.1 ABC transporter ATP-binding protein [Solibacillus sp. MA9]
MIEFQHVSKKYGTTKALADVSLTIESGTIYGFVGANGAGKSTAFSILATLIPVSSGDILVNGKSVTYEAHAVRAMIGYMPDFFGVYDQLKVEEYLDFYGSAYQLSEAVRAKKITELLSLVRLTEKRFEYVDDLSRGMKQRLCLARTLIHNPDILILDEPASGLDPRARVEMRDILKDLKRLGKTICISSHILPELAEICDEIGVLHAGRLIASGNIAEIEAQLQGEKWVTVSVVEDEGSALAFFANLPQVANATQQGDAISFVFTGDEYAQAAVLKQAIEAGIRVSALEVQKKNLEDVFMVITKEVAQRESQNI